MIFLIGVGSLRTRVGIATIWSSRGELWGFQQIDHLDAVFPGQVCPRTASSDCRRRRGIADSGRRHRGAVPIPPWLGGASGAVPGNFCRAASSRASIGAAVRGRPACSRWCASVARPVSRSDAVDACCESPCRLPQPRPPVRPASRQSSPPGPWSSRHGGLLAGDILLQRRDGGAIRRLLRLACGTGQEAPSGPMKTSARSTPWSVSSSSRA